MDKLIKLELEEMKEQEERFRIIDNDTANWAFRKLRAIQLQENQIKETAKKEIDRIKDWEKKELESTEGAKSHFEGLLMEYYIRNKELNSKFKINTPYGKVTSRKQQPKWNYEESKLTSWLLQNDKDLIRVKHEPNKVELKKKYKVVGNQVATEDGEIVEGISIEERPDSVNIKVVE